MVSDAKMAALRACEQGDLLHSVYGGYDWRRGEGGWSRRCTRQVQSLVRDGLVQICPRQRGDEHRGQAYELTDAGRRVLEQDRALGGPAPEEG